MSRLRVALVGAGTVGQAEHAFYLRENASLFSFAAIVDPSARVRREVGDRFGVAQRVATVDELDLGGLDAIICAAPDALHAGATIWAFDHGLHVLCEKPLAITVADCDAMIAARDRAGRVGQIAYMKIYDPAFERLLELLPERVEDIAAISVECNDPDAAPFIAHLGIVPADDLADDVRAQGRALLSEQVREAAGRDVSDAERMALTAPFLSSLVHDIGLVHAILERVGQPLPAPLTDASYFAGGGGGHLGLALQGGGRVAAYHLSLLGVNDYTERLSVFCTDRILELTFPSPWLRNMPTRLVEKRSSGSIELATTSHHASYEESFQNELRAFHAAVVDGAPVRSTFEHGRRDVVLLVAAHRLAMRTVAEAHA